MTAQDDFSKIIDVVRRKLCFLSLYMENLAKRYAGEMISLVATNNGKIVGTAMGTKDELIRLYVRHRYHGTGIGRSLMQRFEQQCIQRGSRSIRIRSSLQAVLFYLKMGYNKTTGKRNFRGLKCQSMKKICERDGMLTIVETWISQIQVAHLRLI